MLTFTLSNAVVTGEAITVTATRDDSSTAATTDYSLSDTSVTLSMGSPSGTITVTADADAVVEENEDIVLSYTVTGDGTTAGVAAIANTTITITDDDAVAGITVDPDGTIFIRGGFTADFEVSLASRPTGTVTVTLMFSSYVADNLRLSYSTSVNVSSLELTFTTSNWNDTQEVTLSTAGANIQQGTANIDYTASGGGYDSVTRSQRVLLLVDTPEEE